MGTIIYGLGLCVIAAIRIHQRWCARQRVVVRRQITWRESMVLVLAITGVLIVPLLCISTDLFVSAAYQLPPWTTWLGAALFGAAIWLIWRSHADLGRNWSATLVVRQNHQLVTDGIYTHIRHPMYAGFLLWGIAQPLLLQNAIAGWTHLAAMLILYLVRIPQEEAMMQATFGAAYTAYLQRTGRIIPKRVVRPRG